MIVGIDLGTTNSVVGVGGTHAFDRQRRVDGSISAGLFSPSIERDPRQATPCCFHNGTALALSE
jgi:hypothetical protein